MNCTIIDLILVHRISCYRFGDIMSELRDYDDDSLGKLRMHHLSDADIMEIDDDGITYTYQLAIGKAMGKWASSNTPAFVVGLGDNFYVNGVESTTDSMWDTHWKNVYLDNYLTLKVPWYTVFG